MTEPILTDKIYVDGRFITPHGTAVLETVSPSTMEKMARVVLADETDVLGAVAAAKRAFPSFARTTPAERREYLNSLREAMLKKVDELTEVIIREYGAPIKVARARAELTADSFKFTRDVLEDFSFTERAGGALVFLEPAGVVGIITPWNASSSSVCMKLASALGAGCTTVIKPSEFSPLQTMAMTEGLAGAGLPPGVINVVTGLGPAAGEALSTSPDVDMMSFTGSTGVGKQIYRNGAETVRKTTLELSGKSPNIILPDADLDKALPQAVWDCFGNNGQMCIAGSRLLVPRSLQDKVATLVKKIIEGIKVGYPWEPETQIGPVVNQTQFERVQRYLDIGVNEADLLTGGPGKPAGLESGFFVKPTAFINVTNQMTIAREDVFGPVVSIISYNDVDEAVEIANDTVFGLAAYISGRDLDRAREVAGRLRAGRVVINGPRNSLTAPFGGFKQSGLGREYGAHGLRECLEPKTVLGWE
ncbi:MAG: aldehyde dehydrogenase family protein [Deltaproteobacteria bacterium]|jgi:aldehyde dehydrogenase (NAD+)|nr:aldehyde dehydrogenase family protein [Deltaproteobacteria bacterium]